MPNGGSDCCATCPFNGVNEGESRYPPKGATGFVCELRDFEIDVPFWTYCNNHPRRNPRLVRAPRGPVWAAVFVDYDSKPLREGVRLPPELVPPQGDGMYVRVPYFGVTRPSEQGAGACTVCGEESERTFSVAPPGEEESSFCSVAHYLEWWLASAPEAEFYHAAPVQDARALGARLEETGARLLRAAKELLGGKKDPAANALAELEGVLADLGYGTIDLAHAAVFLEHPEMEGGLSPHLLRLRLQLARAGEILAAEDLDAEAAREAVYDIVKTIGEYLSREV